MHSPSGWVLLDKPEGISSNAALRHVKRAVGAKKAGHAGTLDPQASGLLLIAIGEACKFLSALDFATKRYRFSLHWGAATSTDDAEGEILATSTHIPPPEVISKTLAHFIGGYQQSPPAFSALKINGQRAYKRARAGNFERLTARSVMVHDFRLLSHDSQSAISTLEVHFGKGGYVRAIGRDLAEHLHTHAHVQHIRRTHIGKLDVSTAIPLASYIGLDDNALESGSREILALESVLDDIPALDVTAFARQGLVQGKHCTLDQQTLSRAISPPPSQSEPFADKADDGARIYLLRHKQRVFGLGTIEAGVLKPKRLLHYRPDGDGNITDIGRN